MISVAYNTHYLSIAQRNLATLFHYAINYKKRDIKEFFNTEHVTVIGKRKASHAVCYRFFYQSFNRRLTVKYGILRVYVKMYKWYHSIFV